MKYEILELSNIKYKSMKKSYYILIIFLLFLFPRDLFAQYTCNEAAIGGGGFVTGVINHKTSGDVYCRTDVGGAYRWDVVNSKWIELLDWISDSQCGYAGVESIALDPQNANNVYMLCGTSYFNGGATAILKSTDKGNTFTVIDVTSQFKAHGNGMGRSNGERLAVDPNNSSILFCGTRANGLWKSTNGGSTWTLAWSGVTTTTNANGICFVVFDPASVSGGVTKTIYIGVSQTGSANIYKSTDGGSTFTAISANTSFMPHHASLTGTTMYVTHADAEGPWNTSGTGRIYKLNTSTGVWSNVTPFGNNYSYGGICVDPLNASRVVATSINMYTNNQYGTTWGDYVYLSTDGGSTWTLKNSNTSTYNNNGIGWSSGQLHWAGDIEFTPGNTAEVRSISGNGIFTCSNINAANPSWIYDVKALEETGMTDGISIPGGRLLTTFGDITGFIHSSLTAYPSQTHLPADGSNWSIDYAAASTSKIVRVGSSNIYYSTDQGSTWTATSTNKGTQGNVAISADGGTILHCPNDGTTTTWYTTNNGGSWTGASGVALAYAIPVSDPVNSNYFYIHNLSNGQMFVSSNKGVSFSVLGTPGATSTPWVQTYIRTVPGYEGHVWVPLVGNGLKYSTDHGATYTKLSNVTYCSAVGIGKADVSATYPTVFIWGTVGGVRGMFVSTDKGATWTRVNDNAHQFGGTTIIFGDMNIFGRVYMSGVSGRGVIYFDAPTTPTSSPTANFSASTTSPCVGATVIFTDASTGVPASWSWNFGSGATPATATGAGPISVTYSTTGTKTVSLTATNSFGSNTNTKTNYLTVITVPPAAGVITGPATVCAGSTGKVYSITAVTGATGYNWTVPTGATITAGANTTSITVSFGSTAGNVSVIPTNTCGNGTSNSLAISVSQAPTAANSGSAQSICTTTATLAANTPVTGTGAWSVVSGTGSFSNANSATSAVSGLSNGANTLRWTISNAPCTASVSNVVINVTTSGAALPLSEGFENATFVPTGWALSNPGNGRTFVRNTSVGGDGLSTNCTQVQCFGYTTSNGIGDKDVLESPALNLSGLSSASMTFKVAYTYFKQGVTLRWDSLNVYVSADCGAYTKVYNKGKDLLKTSTEKNTAYSPISTEWRTETIDLSSYIGASVLRVRFEVVNGNGNNIYLDDINITGVVSSTPVANFTKSASTLCQGSIVTFTNTSTGTITSYAWDFGAGASPATASTAGPHNVIYSTSGTKTISLTLNGSVIKTDNVTVDAQPTIANASTDQNICGATTATLNGNSPATGTGLWTLVSGAAAITTPSSNTSGVTGLAANGTATLRWTISNGVCTSSSDDVVINTIAPTTANAGTDQYITTASTSLAGNSPSPNSGTWTVVSGTGNFNNAASYNTTVSGLSTGSNTFQWTINNGFCTSSSDQVIINVGTSPVSQSINGNQYVTPNSQGLTYSVPNNAGSTYTWTIPSGATIVSGQGTSSIVVDFGTQGGTLGVTETNSFGSAVSSVSIAVGNAPVAQTISGPANVASGTSGVTYSLPNNAGSTYNWTVPSGATIVSGQGTSSIVVDFGTQGGTVDVTETNSFGSASSSASVNVNIATATFSAANSSVNVIAYPNPFSEEINITFNNYSAINITLKVIDMKGEVVYESNSYQTNQKINLGKELPAAGLYTVIAIYDNKRQIVKVEKVEN
jgi:xyloglucan-specific exo-beta-1,4-glucanase